MTDLKYVKAKDELLKRLLLLLITVILFVVILEIILRLSRIDNIIGQASNIQNYSTIEQDEQKYWEAHTERFEEYNIRTKNNVLLYHPSFKDHLNTSKDNQTFRIIFLGDSVTFGVNIPSKSIFPTLMKEKWKELYENENLKIEVLNFGQPGYDLLQINLLFEEEAVHFKPDLIIYIFSGNDPQTTRYKKINSTHIYGETAINRYEYVLTLPFNDILLENLYTYRFINKRIINICEKLDCQIEKKEYYVSTEKTAKALNNIVYTCREKNISLYIVNLPVIEKNYPVNEFLLRYLTKENLEYIRLLEIGSVLTEYDPNDIRISDEDAHFNTKGHKIMAEILFNDLIYNTNLLPSRIN